MSIITIKGLNKGYKKQAVLTDLNWQIEQGDVVGLLGKNGVGKSTLLKSLLNISEVDSGQITIFGELHHHLSINSKAKIGYVPQEHDEIAWLSINHLIKFRKQFYTQWSDNKVQQLMTRWKIDGSKKVSELSPGQMQKVLIILAISPEPELLIFDEPAAALDPAGRRDFLKEIVTLANDDQITIIFSTHIVSDLERVANKVAILDKGNICYFDELDAFKENVVQLIISHDDQKSIQTFNIPHVLRRDTNSGGIKCVVAKLDQAWIEQIKKQGYKININPMPLEDIFLDLTA